MSIFSQNVFLFRFFSQSFFFLSNQKEKIKRKAVARITQKRLRAYGLVPLY